MESWWKRKDQRANCDFGTRNTLNQALQRNISMKQGRKSWADAETLCMLWSGMVTKAGMTKQAEFLTGRHSSYNCKSHSEPSQSRNLYIFLEMCGVSPMNRDTYFMVTSQGIKWRNLSVYIIIILVVSYIWFLINTIYFVGFNIGILIQFYIIC